MRKKDAYLIDDTLRFLYCTLWNRGLRLVAIEFVHKGKVWRADTVDEAIRLRQTLEMMERAASEVGFAPGPLIDPVWTADLVMELFKNTGALQKRFLRALAESVDEADSSYVVKELGLDSAVSLAGVLSGLSKQVRKLGLKPWQLYVVRVEWAGKQKMRLFQLSRDFKSVAGELGWPESEIDK